MVRVLRSRPIESLRNTLTRVVEQDPSLAHARTVLLQPLDVLANLGREVDGVLTHDDPAAMERLRRLISMVGAWALQLLDAVEGDTQAPDDGEEPPTPAGVDAGDAVAADAVRPCHGGLVDSGAVVLIALAAARVGRRQGDPVEFLRTVKALALAVAPAEGLARGIADGFTDDQVASVLSIVASTDSVDARLSAVVPTLVDECELARWTCVGSLVDEVASQASLAWETTFSHVIAGVRPLDDGLLEVRFHELDPRYDVAGYALLEELKPQGGATARFVFVDDDGNPIEARAKSAAPTKLTAKVAIPDGARAGWLGVTTDDAGLANRDAMESLRSHWIARNAGPCLRDQPVDTDVIPDPAEDGVRKPPAAAGARWGVEIVDSWLEQAGGGPLYAGTPTEVTAALSGADDETLARVVVDGTPVPATVEGGHARVELPAYLVVDGAHARIEVFRTRADHPDDVLPFTLDVIGPPRPEPDETTRPIVLLWPTFVDGKHVRRARPLSSRLRMRSNLPYDAQIEVVELPFVADEELVFDGVPQTANDPLIDAVLERLAGLAARTSGIERATVIAVVPGESSFFALQPAEAARGVALATASALDDVLAQPLPPPRPRARRLRIVGRIHRNDVVVDEPVRVEADRPAGGRAPYLTQVLAVAVDEHGRELRSERIAIHASGRTGRFSMLLPVGPAVAAVELRNEPELLAVELRAQPRAVQADFRDLGGDVSAVGGVFSPRVFERPRPLRGGPLPVIHRPSGDPRLSGVALQDGAVTWRYTHSHGARARIELEVGRGDGIWSRFAVSGSHRSGHSLAGLRTLSTRPPTQLRLVASDGWNSTQSPPVQLPPPPEPRSAVRVRRLGRRRFVTEANHDTGPITWSIDGEFKGERDPDEVFVAEPGDVGKTVRATTLDGVADEITIGPGEI